MKRVLFFLPLFVLTLVACSDDDYVMPDYRQDLCLFTYHGAGRNCEFTIDHGETFLLSTPVNFDNEIKPDSAYRMLITYVIDSDNPTYASLFQLQQVPLLADSTHNVLKSDTLSNVTSVWMGGGFINLALQFKHDGKELRQSFGYRVDGVDHKGEHAHHHLSLFYRKNGLPLEYYTYTYNFSIRPEDLKAEKGDTVTFHTVTKRTEGGQTLVDMRNMSVIY